LNIFYKIKTFVVKIIFILISFQFLGHIENFFPKILLTIFNEGNINMFFFVIDEYKFHAEIRYLYLFLPIGIFLTNYKYFVFIVIAYPFYWFILIFLLCLGCYSFAQFVGNSLLPFSLISAVVLINKDSKNQSERTQSIDTPQ